MEELGNNTLGNVAASCMAIQHILVSKGICSFDELSTSNRRAQEIMTNIAEAAHLSETEGFAGLSTGLKEMVAFIGGNMDNPGLEESKIHEMIDQLMTEVPQETT